MKIQATHILKEDTSATRQAEDIAYTLNHALACTATDFIDPYFGNLTQKYFGKRLYVGCGHDHSKDGGTHCAHHQAFMDEAMHSMGLEGEAMPPRSFGRGAAKFSAPKSELKPIIPPPTPSYLKHWVAGEIIGDFGAVPITLAVIRFAPGITAGIGAVLEATLGPLFHKGAQRSARIWAKQNGLAADSRECHEKGDALYRSEIRHLPQALLWTASSIALNLSTQKHMGNPAPLWQLMASKAIGASISAGLVVGGRAMAPQSAQCWDNATSERLFLPIARMLGASPPQETVASSWVERAHASGRDGGIKA